MSPVAAYKRQLIIKRLQRGGGWHRNLTLVGAAFLS